MMKRIPFFFALLLTLALQPRTAGAEPAKAPAPAAATQPAERNLQTDMAKGKSLFVRKEYAEARKLFEEIVINSGSNPKAKSLHAARLWLAKTLFMQQDAKGAAEQLELLLKNPAASGLEPATIYEAHFDLAACRLMLGQKLPAALDYLNVGVSAAPAGMEKVRETALGNARLIACTMLGADEITALERVAKTPDLQAFFLNERMQKYLRENNTGAFKSSIPLTETLLRSPSVSPLYRQLLLSLQQQQKALAKGTMKERRIGILLPLEFTVYSRSSALPAGNRVFAGLYNRLLKQQINQPELLINTATASTSGREKNPAEKLIASHRPTLLIGPLFSAEAVEAARAAKSAKIPLVTPTATDSRITDNNPWCFQLNPTHEERGRIAARELLKTSKPEAVAAIAEKSPYLEEMAKGFLDEIKLAGTKKVVYGALAADTDSAAAATAIGGMRGKTFDALYLPMDKPAVIDRTLSLLESSRTGYKRLLGSGIWEEKPVLTRFKGRIPNGITFFSDYHTKYDGAKTAEIASSQQLLWNTPLSAYFWYGYDTLDYLLNLLALKPVGGARELAQALRSAPLFRAHYSSYEFGGGNVNRSMNVLRHENNATRKIR